MSIKNIIVVAFCLAYCSDAYPQDHHERYQTLDALHYSFTLHLNDSTDLIQGIAEIKIAFKKEAGYVDLDLVKKSDSSKGGMLVKNVTNDGKPIHFDHHTNQLRLHLENPVQKGDTSVFTVFYAGVPIDGLIISNNKFGDRTFFGDNWPNRARHWLPAIDHPSDKAALDFQVYAPCHYQVVSNGMLIEESNVGNGIKFTHWKEENPIATKLMVIGVARFAVQYNQHPGAAPVSTWVFPQNRDNGFYDYRHGMKILQFFYDLIGPYSYGKLAHVQSKTKYGGMENAGCIFYAERTVSGLDQQERLMVHETAHQWFGDAVTERNWHHIWLSEGFATYLTHVYNQHFKGEEIFREGLKKDRRRVIEFSKRHPAPVIDTSITDYNRLLNANTYQKAGWFLHMLRNHLGDTLFFKGLRNYYNAYKDSTALTKDFKMEMEKVYGSPLDSFFNQWLMLPGLPELEIGWKQNKNWDIELEINQHQENLFEFPLEMEIVFDNGDIKQIVIPVKNSKESVRMKTDGKVTGIDPDPKVKLLFNRTD